MVFDELPVADGTTLAPSAFGSVPLARDSFRRDKSFLPWTVPNGDGNRHINPRKWIKTARLEVLSIFKYSSYCSSFYDFGKNDYICPAPPRFN